jgi:broad specificity phosphatase PhoE
MKRPLLYVVRHGSTTDSGKKIYRGQKDSALDKEGFRDAHVLKEFFKDKEWDQIFCSRTTRTIQTATVICDDQSEYQPQVLDGEEPWNIGSKLTGAPKNKTNQALMDFYVNNPDEVPEDGESRHEFEHRVWPILAFLIELGWKNGKPAIDVTHSSVIHSLNHLLEGESHPRMAVKPGGVIEVYLEDGEILHRPIFKPGTDDSSFESKNS